VTDENIAARSWFVSASSCARRARASSRARSTRRLPAGSPPQEQSLVPCERASALRSLRDQRAQRDVGRDDGDHLGRPSARNARTNRLRLDVLAVERDGHLTGREPERLQSLDELVEHPIGDVAGEELRRQEGQQPRLTLAAARAVALIRRIADDQPDDDGDREEHDRGDQVAELIEAEHPVRVLHDRQGDRSQHRGDHACPEPAADRGDRDGEDEDRDARALQLVREQREHRPRQRREEPDRDRTQRQSS
jgi:hypothetical protein